MNTINSPTISTTTNSVKPIEDSEQTTSTKDKTEAIGYQSIFMNISGIVFNTGSAIINQLSILKNSLMGTTSIQPTKIYTETLAYARSLLKENPNLAPVEFKCHPPINKEISLLFTLYWDLKEEFGEAIKSHDKDPWANKNVLEAADRLMKIAYAISILTLEDLGPFTRYIYLKEGFYCSYAKALTRHDSYQYRTFYYCTTVYHVIRGQVESITKRKWKSMGGVDIDNDYKGRILFYLTDDIPKGYSKSFYEEGTLQNQWNQLYNDYCDRVRYYVNESDLSAQDNRHVLWTKKDLNEKCFEREPTTQPT